MKAFKIKGFRNEEKRASNFLETFAYNISNDILTQSISIGYNYHGNNFSDIDLSSIRKLRKPQKKHIQGNHWAEKSAPWKTIVQTEGIYL